MMRKLQPCMLCPRKCGADRENHRGVCGADWQIKIARAALHPWEEPCISGSRGSGAVFFSGCALKCVYCQNHEISDGKQGMEVTAEHLADILLRLQEQGAHNINLVTPTHYSDQLIPVLQSARRQGLSIPIVYNTGGYEEVDALKRLEGLIDIWMPDLKYIAVETAKRYSGAPDYFEMASKAIAEMFRQNGQCLFDQDGMMTKGVLVRHLVLPGHVKEARAVIKYLYDTYKDAVYISIMNQYTPVLSGKAAADYPELTRSLTKREYERVVDYAISLGISNAFIQEGDVAKESFIPSFDGEGI